MKKLNKKGFTLIELLAVIIILGVLMIIAIPSVTEYISSSRKSAYVDTAVGYIDSVRTKVNQADKLQFFDVNTLYLVPVGNTNGVCVSVEKGGNSPFSDTWQYAYVGVTYTGKNYNYYFVALDGSNQGINFASDDALAKEGGDLVVSGTAEIASYANLKTHYGTTTNGKLTPGLTGGTVEKYLSATHDPAHYGLTVAEDGTVSGTAVEGYDELKANMWAEPTNTASIEDWAQEGGTLDFAEYVEKAEVGKNIDEIQVIPSDAC